MLQHIYKDIPKISKQECSQISKIVIFGHSHKPLIQQTEGTLFFNPGSAGPKRFNLPISVGILQISNDSVKSEITTLIQD